MSRSKLTRLDVYLSTGGYCHLTNEKLVWENYGKIGMPGAWEIDHDVPRALGGGDEIENLFAAGVSANRSTQATPSEYVRALNGMDRRPLSPEETLDELEAAERMLMSMTARAGAMCGALAGLARARNSGEALAHALIGGALGGLVGWCIGAKNASGE